MERSCAGEGVDKTGSPLNAGRCQGSEDLPGLRAFRSFVAAGDFAGDHRVAQLTFGKIIGSIDALVIQKGEEMIALFMESIAHGFFVRFAARSLQQLNGFVFQGLAQITEGFQAELSFGQPTCSRSIV